jgi:hypothetical protein
MEPASPSLPPQYTCAYVPSATFARTDGHAKSVLSPFRRVLTTLQAVFLAALCIPACEMVKREVVCTAHGSTASALRRDLDAANERDAPPEAAERAAATIRASAKTLDPAAGAPTATSKPC